VICIKASTVAVDRLREPCVRHGSIATTSPLPTACMPSHDTVTHDAAHRNAVACSSASGSLIRQCRDESLPCTCLSLCMGSCVSLTAYGGLTTAGLLDSQGVMQDANQQRDRLMISATSSSSIATQ